MSHGSSECDLPALSTLCQGAGAFYETVSHTASLPSGRASIGRLLNCLTREYKRATPTVSAEPRIPQGSVSDQVDSRREHKDLSIQVAVLYGFFGPCRIRRDTSNC